MKRDWDLIREILLRLEEKGPEAPTIRATDFGEERRHQAAYNVEILEEAGLIDARMAKSLNAPPDFLALRLTWSGHELLDTIRSETVWTQTKETFVSKGLSMTFDLVKSVAAGIATDVLTGKIGG